MELTLKVMPENVFNEIMDSGEIKMNDLVEQLVMDEFYTKKTLSKSAIDDLRSLIEYIDRD